MFAVLLYLFALHFFAVEIASRGLAEVRLVAAGPVPGLLVDQAAHDVIQTTLFGAGCAPVSHPLRTVSPLPLRGNRGSILLHDGGVQ